ncbi:hypothetical protein [Scytonema sp. NUACC26]|uniref:hypothetical protein n=1 Tax=Scytonema sp. NUACC26 TaxID=3140176 RepID=UPI0034DC7CDE
MIQNFIEQIGDWNRQFLREIRGRLKMQNILLAISTSLLSQLVLYVLFAVKLPPNRVIISSNYSPYCTGTQSITQYRCLHHDLSRYYLINWELFWQGCTTYYFILWEPFTIFNGSFDSYFVLVGNCGVLSFSVEAAIREG